MPKNPFASLGLLLGTLLLSACDGSSSPEDATPLATVAIETIEARPLSISSELSGRIAAPRIRSEEHTSELQSLMRISYAVFCLKKKIHKQHNTKNKKSEHTSRTDY